MRLLATPYCECQSHILAPYRFWAYLGFVLGTAYQYAIMEILIGVINDRS